MCGSCGCSDNKNAITMTDVETGKTNVLRQGGLHHQEAHDHDHPHDHAHPHDHIHAHSHDHDHHPHEGEDQPHIHGPGGEVIALETAILAKNDTLAAANRGWFEGRGVLALNLVSSPGAGKTSLLERTIRECGKDMPISVIEGDQMTTNDADRIRDAGAKAIQINTGAGCHLEADMVGEAAKKLNPQSGSILMIENVGNLVCPAMFDLGERMKIAIISTTEGEDKPLKYPHMFRAAQLAVINKMDLAPHVDFDEETCRKNIAEVNSKAQILCVSAKTGDGMEEWIAFLRKELEKVG